MKAGCGGTGGKKEKKEGIRGEGREFRGSEGHGGGLQAREKSAKAKRNCTLSHRGICFD